VRHPPPSQKSKRPELVVLAIFIVVGLGAWAVWVHRWKAQAAQRDEMFALYATASGGDRASVRRLAEYPSPEATQLIQKLAQDQGAFPEGRLEAISVLRANPSVDSKTLAPLLWIDQPFIIRRAAAAVFKQRGCDERCISSTLTALRAIWAGQPTSEMQATALIPSPTSHAQDNLVYFHRQTEEDYFVLLNSNACLTRKTLQNDYAADSEFGDKIRNKLGSC